MHTFCQMWGVTKPEDAIAIIDRQRRDAGLKNLSSLEGQAISLVGRDEYETLIKGYTEKQWGRPCRELPAGIIKRLPVRFSFNNNYFNDRFQGIPEGGYNILIDSLLEGVECRTDCNYIDNRSALEGIADKNSNTDVPYTRVVEHKWFDVHNAAAVKASHTVITREYPQGFTAMDDPYYPINDDYNNRLYHEYLCLARKEAANIIFAGRLGAYKYLDMDQTVAAAMSLERKEHEYRA